MAEDYTWLDGLGRLLGPSEAQAAVLIPTENSRSKLAQSRTKDALRMQEKGYTPDFIANTTGVYTGGNDFWKHVVPTQDPYTRTILDDQNHKLNTIMNTKSLEAYDPEFKDVDVYFNSDIPKNLVAHASYTPAEDSVYFDRSKAHGGLLDHELTHRAELYGGRTTPTRMFRELNKELDNKVPYFRQSSEINANIAQATSDDKTRAEAIQTLNKIYKYGRPNNIMEVYTRAGN